MRKRIKADKKKIEDLLEAIEDYETDDGTELSSEEYRIIARLNHERRKAQ
jgi:hypothetical protein